MRRAVIAIIFIFSVVGCVKEKPDARKKNVAKASASVSNYVDLEHILKRDTLIAITGYNAYSYFIYRGQPMGYEYELLNLFAKSLGVHLKIIVERDLEQMFTDLETDKGDLIAYSLTITAERRKRVAFTIPLRSTKQVLVQRRPDGWRRMTLDQIRKRIITSPLQLAGKDIYVASGSAYIERLKNLSEEIGGGINIIVADSNLTTEDLIRMVAEKEIDYTVADEEIALMNQAYYYNLDVSLEISLPQYVAWAVRKTSVHLLRKLNEWISHEKKRNDYYVIYQRYFENRLAYRRRLKSDFFSHTGGKISRYDDLIKKYSKELGWDWRIVASLIYQESHFDPKAKSWAGAVGLMQLLPVIGKQYNVKNLEDPYENIKAGMKYLKWLDDYWARFIKDKDERIKFVLASYNIGLGHIQDARRLAEKYGADPNIWEGNVEYYLLKKSDPKYYNDPVVRNGFALGKETVKYVREILDRYREYKKFIA
jgi:membrane-bound lytic murein transglycosylase F